MAKKTIDISGSATKMVDDINDNFSELYEGAGASASVPTKHVKVYDAMTRCYQGSGAGTIYIPCDIKAGVNYVVEKSEDGNNWSILDVKICDSSKTAKQTLITVNGSGTVTVGAFNSEVESNQDGSYFSIYSYPTGEINIYHYEDVPMLGASRWLGKRWLVIGDSISTEHRGLAGTGYSELVANSLGMQRENMAISGTSSINWLQVSGAVWKSWSNYRTDYDLITVMLGSNDQGYNCSIGSLNDSEYAKGAANVGASYIARMQLLYELLREKYPKSVIAFITPLKRYDYENSRYMINALNLTTEPYAQAVKTVCDYYSIPCIDVFNSIDPYTDTARTNFFMSLEDGSHPNDLGHALFIAPVVEARLREIAPFYFNDWETLNNND